MLPKLPRRPVKRP